MIHEIHIWWLQMGVQNSNFKVVIVSIHNIHIWQLGANIVHKEPFEQGLNP